MNRILSFIMAIACLLPTGAMASAPLRDGDIDITAPSAILMEKETGEVLYEKDAHSRGFPASVTKVMTMLLIVEDLEAGKIRLEDIVTASARAASFGGSCVYLEEGEQMSVSDMLKCIAVVSANDCAVAMAEHLSGTEQVFVERMNKRAEELGLENTHFTNCTGLFDDGDHYTTAYDVAVMSRELVRHDVIKEYTTIWMDSIRNGEFELSNTNKLVYWYPGCTGLKTGYTSTAMYCLSATAERDGVEYIAVIMHGDSIESRNNDAKALLNYAFANYTLCSLRSQEALPQVPVELGREAYVDVDYAGEEYALVPKGGGETKYDVKLLDKVHAPVQTGDRLGTLTVTLNGETVAQIPLCAGSDVPRIGFFGILSKLAGSLIGL